ncbi:MAG: rod shape-determining protein MreC [Candidatus Pacebacteria bacterium]|nr:rod shape-determining protein MreC [Candidatus Paceibacterota bacterium]
MSYLLDKEIKRKKFSKIALCVIFLVIVFYFRVGIWSGLSKVGAVIFHPVLVLGQKVEEKVQSVGSYFVSKNYLYNQNQKLQTEVSFDDARMANYDSVATDNASLKEILNRKDPKANIVLAAILAKPNQSPYDILLIDAGVAEGVKTGDTVFALGNVPIGNVSDVYQDSAKVILFSNPGETTEAVISASLNADGTVSTTTPSASNAFVQVVGRGGGNFEMVMPKDFNFQAGGQVVLPGVNSYVLAVFQKVISDPRSSSTKILLTSPVNIQSLKFVEVEQ